MQGIRELKMGNRTGHGVIINVVLIPQLIKISEFFVDAVVGDISHFDLPIGANSFF